MENLSQQQQIEVGKQTSFTSIIVKNVSIVTKSSTGFDVREPFQSYAEVVDPNYPTNMVSTTSAPTPSTRSTSPFYLLRDDPPKPAETSSTLLVKHGLDQMYQKFCGKKMKESLSSFLPHLPGVVDEHGGPGNSLQSVVDKPPIGGKELLPLPSLSGFLLNAGPIPEQFRFMSQQPVKKKHRHKKHRSQESERGKDGGETVPSSRNLELEKQNSNDKPEGGHEKKHKKQKKHEDGERKKKKKEKKKKKRHTPDPTPPGGGPDPS